MDDAQKSLHCSLETCQTANHLNSGACSHCQTPLIKRYLSVVGTSFKPEMINQLVAERYLVMGKNLVLDLHPAVSPDLPEIIPLWLKPYLKLSPYRAHIPKVYGRIPHKKIEIWLLEYENFSSTVQSQLAKGEFIPAITTVWQEATGTRQLNWLLQISQLWQPLQAQGVGKTLVTPELLRVNGSVVQLQQLRQTKEAVTLKELGELWLTWVESAAPKIQSFLTEVCTNLVEGKIQTSEGLTRFLEDGLEEMARSQSRSYKIATVTDAGPSRSHNEDAYYQQEQPALAIVCDGVGGHQGGAVASKLAIENLPQEIKNLQDDAPKARILSEKIEQAVGTVNDLICDVNDSKNRQAQQRMGTTLVMALAHDHEMYVTHVGDSRLYWITASGCYQLTLDDDLASRQTRLGHLLYREALQQPSAGALVQALGMHSSQLLHPTTQRLIIDEDCVFLLCSDGLSDNDLVEQYWEKEILPVLQGKQDVNTAAQRLLNLANTLNGHDNVTVSLMKCSVSNSQEKTLTVRFQEQTEIQYSQETTFTSPPKSGKTKPSRFGLLVLILGLIISGVGGAYWFFPEVRQSLDQLQEYLKPSPMRDPSELPTPND